jgi:DNA-binding MarR family transcriptional regulator
LESHGLLHFQVDTIDTRRRIVTPTDKAMRLIKKLDEQVASWANAFKG